MLSASHTTCNLTSNSQARTAIDPLLAPTTSTSRLAEITHPSRASHRPRRSRQPRRRAYQHLLSGTSSADPCPFHSRPFPSLSPLSCSHPKSTPSPTHPPSVQPLPRALAPPHPQALPTPPPRRSLPPAPAPPSPTAKDNAPQLCHHHWIGNERMRSVRLERTIWSC